MKALLIDFLYFFLYTKIDLIYPQLMRRQTMSFIAMNLYFSQRQKA